MRICAVNQKPAFQSYNKKKPLNNKTLFKGKPEELNYYDYITYKPKMTPKNVITLYDVLRHAKYTDITHDTWKKIYEPDYSYIRQNNLDFLNNLKTEKEQQEFIDYYEDLTGFPNLEKVSKRIINEFFTVCTSAKNELSKGGKEYDIVAMGYNSTCSVGHRKALPGSDLDGAYVIIKGSNDLEKDKEIIDNFKIHLWKKTDTRILSYNHQAAFPQVYTEKQFYTLLQKMEELTNELNLNEPSENYHGFFKKSKFKYYKSLKNNYSQDYVKANEFFIELCKKIKENFSYFPNYNQPTKELAKNFGFLVETIVNGRIIHSEKAINQEALELREKVLKTNFAQLTNLSQLHALNIDPPPKPKLQLRETLVQQYKEGTTSEKYKIIKELIKAGCDEYNDESLKQYFASGKDNFSPLLKALGKE